MADYIVPQEMREHLRGHLRFLQDHIKPGTLSKLCTLLCVPRPKRHLEPLRTSPGNLRKFALNKNKTLNDDDAEMLHRLFYRTEIGRAVRQLRNRKHRTILNEFVMPAIRSGKAERAKDFEGTYYLYHSSHAYPGEFAVAAMKIARDADNLLVFEDVVKDEHDVQTIERKARGVCTLFREQLQFIRLREDRSLGFGLIISDRYMPSEGRVTHITGQMFGMTDSLRPFQRAVLIVRAPDGSTFEQIVSETGIKQWHEWSAPVRERFKSLRDHPPRTDCDDTVFAHGSMPKIPVAAWKPGTNPE